MDLKTLNLKQKTRAIRFSRFLSSLFFIPTGMLIFLLVFTTAAISFNNSVARQTLYALQDIPVPSKTVLIEGTSDVGYSEENHSHMYYIGAILIRSKLSLEELRSYYSSFSNDEYIFHVTKQDSQDIVCNNRSTGLKFASSIDDSDYYLVYSQGHNSNRLFASIASDR
ncbi:hypothetical protein SAMN06296386_105262 [Lachnospiraceae bacterium]|nr:hypothetical protein SAMN06296386_105262 [Lachnospiraceae bacterium]